MLSDLRGGGLASFLAPLADIILSQILIYYWQEIFVFDTDDKKWSHSLMIPLHCLWAKSNKRLHGQFECDVTWFCFCLDFVQRKQVDCKMSTKNVNNYKWKTFPNIFGQLYTQEYKTTKKQMRLQLTEKKSKESWSDGRTW